MNKKKKEETLPSSVTTSSDDSKFLAELNLKNPFAIAGGYDGVKAYLTLPETQLRFNETQYGILKEFDYCYRVDLFNYNNRTNIFNSMSFLTDYDLGSKQ